MLDDVKIVFPLEEPIEICRRNKVKPLQFNNIEFYPKYNTKTGYVKYYDTLLDNLWLKISEDKLTINNSWHKYSKGNNFTDYSITDIQETYSKLSNSLNIDIINSEVKKIAYGCVINTPSEINYNNWKFYKTIEPSPMKKNSKKYGAKFDLTDYSIKGYDKSAEVWMHNKIKTEEELFRFEVEVKNMKYLKKRKHPINIHTVRDMLKYENLQLLMSDMLQKYNAIEKVPFCDFSGLTKEERSVFSMMQYSPLREYLRKKENKTYKRYKSKLKTVERRSEMQYHYNTKHLLTEKAIQLLNT